MSECHCPKSVLLLPSVQQAECDCTEFSVDVPQIPIGTTLVNFDIFTGNVSGFVLGDTRFLLDTQTRPPAEQTENDIVINAVTGAASYEPSASEQAAADTDGDSIIRYQQWRFQTTDACECEDSVEFAVTIPAAAVDPCGGKSVIDPTIVTTCTSLAMYNPATMDIDLDAYVTGFNSPVFTQVACLVGTAASGTLVNISGNVWRYSPTSAESGQSVNLCWMVTDADGCDRTFMVTMSVLEFCSGFSINPNLDITTFMNTETVADTTWELRFAATELLPGGHSYDLTTDAFFVVNAATSNFFGVLAYDDGAGEFVYTYGQDEVCELVEIGLTFVNDCDCPPQEVVATVHPAGNETACELTFDGGSCASLPGGSCGCPTFELTYGGTADTTIETEMIAAAFNVTQTADATLNMLGGAEVADEYIKRYDLPSGGLFLVFIQYLTTGWSLEGRLYDVSGQLVGRPEFMNDTGATVACADRLDLGTAGPGTFNGLGNETEFGGSTAIINP